MGELPERIKAASSAEELQKLQEECESVLDDLNESQLDSLLLAVVRAGHEGLMMTIGSKLLQTTTTTASQWDGKGALVNDIVDAVKGCIEEPLAADGNDKQYGIFLAKLVACLKTSASFEAYSSKLFEIVEISLKTDQHYSPIHVASQTLISAMELKRNLALVARGTLIVVNFIRVYPTLAEAPAFHTCEKFLNFAYLRLADEETVDLGGSNGALAQTEAITSVSQLYAFVLPSISDLFSFCAAQKMVVDQVFTLSYLFVHFVFEHFLCDGYIDAAVLKPMMATLINLQSNTDEKIRQTAEEILLVAVEKDTSLIAVHTEQCLDLFMEGKLAKLLPFLVELYKLEPKQVENHLEKLFASLQTKAKTRDYILSLLVEVARRSASLITKQQIAMMVEFLKESELVQKVFSFLEAVAASRLEDVLLHEGAIVKVLFSHPNLLARNGVLLSLLTTSESKASTNLQLLASRLESAKESSYQAALLSNMHLVGLLYPKALVQYRVLFETLRADERLKPQCDRMLKVIDSGQAKATNAGKATLDKKPAVRSQRRNSKAIEKPALKADKAPWLVAVSALLNTSADNDWRSVAVRLGFSNDDIRKWTSMPDPCLAMLQAWLASNTSSHATYAVYRVLLDVNRTDAAALVAQAFLHLSAACVDDDKPLEAQSVFLSYQWASLRQVKLLRRHLALAGYAAWMDVHEHVAPAVDRNGDKPYAKSDAAMRASEVVVCCVSELYAQSASCSREVTLAVSLGKPVVPLLLENTKWPPQGTTNRVFNDHLCIHFFTQTNDNLKYQRKDAYWRDDKFSELLMQLRYIHAPDQSIIPRDSPYKNWWLPAPDLLLIDNDAALTDRSKANARRVSLAVTKPEQGIVQKTYDVFLSYQWDMQPYVKVLYRRLTQLGYSCWFDIMQMSGEQSLYEKIERALKSCRVVVSFVSKKYALSVSCRREVNLANVLKKPIVPFLLEEVNWPLKGPVGSVLAQLAYIDFSKHISRFKGQKNALFDQLTSRIDTFVIDPSLSMRPEQNSLSRTSSLSDAANRRMSLSKVAVGKGTQPVPNRYNSNEEFYRRMSLNVVQYSKSSQSNNSNESVPVNVANANNSQLFIKQSLTENTQQTSLRRPSYLTRPYNNVKLPEVNNPGAISASVD